MYFVLALDQQIYCRKFSKFILNRRINLTVYEPNSESIAVSQFVFCKYVPMYVFRSVCMYVIELLI